MMSLHINNHYAKKSGIGKKLLLTIRIVMLQEHMDLDAGDFNGVAWRRTSALIVDPFALLKKHSLIPPGPTPLWGPGGVPGEWADVCGLLKPLGSETEWEVRMDGAFTIPFGTLSFKEKDQSCHHVHTLTCCTHIFCCVLSLSFIVSLLTFHPSLVLLFLDGHFDTTPDFDFTDDPIHMILP